MLLSRFCGSPLIIIKLVGFLQYIESTPVAEVLATEGSIQNFFRKHHPSETGPFGIAPEVMDTYVSSCGEYIHIKYMKLTSPS